MSNQTAGGYIREAKELLRIDPGKIDIPALVGESPNIYDHVSEMALRIAAEHPEAEVRLKAMAIVLKTQSDRLDGAYLRHWAAAIGVADLLE